MQKLLIIFILGASVLAAGCTDAKIPLVHRMDIPQGNVVTQDMLDRLEPGLNKRQVTYIMGSPMIVDVFNQEEWIYLYSFKPGGSKRVQRRVSLYFENDALVRVTGDVRQTEELPLAVRSAGGGSRSVEVPEGVGAGYEDGGILQGVIDRFAALNPLGDDDEDGPGARPAPEAKATTGDTPAGPAADRDTLRRFSLGSDDVQAPPTDEDGTAAAPAAGDEGQDRPQPPADADKDKGGELSFFERLKRSVGLGEDAAETDDAAKGE